MNVFICLLLHFHPYHKPLNFFSQRYRLKQYKQKNIREQQKIEKQTRALLHEMIISVLKKKEFEKLPPKTR